MNIHLQAIILVITICLQAIYKPFQKPHDPSPSALGLGNGEDLEGFAGAGLFESVCAEEERGSAMGGAMAPWDMGWDLG